MYYDAIQERGRERRGRDGGGQGRDDDEESISGMLTNFSKALGEYTDDGTEVEYTDDNTEVEGRSINEVQFVFCTS